MDQEACPADGVGVGEIARVLQQFPEPPGGDRVLTRLPGNMPAMSSVKLVKYDEEGWTAKRTKTLEHIKDVIQDSR